MFENDNVVEFVNKIINNSQEEDKEIGVNLEKFKEYLKLTKMGDDDITCWLDRVIACLPEIMALKKKIKTINIISIVELKNNNKLKKESKKTLTKKHDENINVVKHYHHYETVNTSSNCGGGSTTRRGC